MIRTKKQDIVPHPKYLVLSNKEGDDRSAIVEAITATRAVAVAIETEPIFEGYTFADLFAQRAD